jgi:hypothetical protein
MHALRAQWSLRKGKTLSLPPGRRHIVPGCFSFSHIKMDPWVQSEMDDTHIAKIHPKSEIKIFLLCLKNAF